MAAQADQFVEQVDQIRTLLNDETINVCYGRLNLGENKANECPRSVVFIPMQGEGDETPQLKGRVEIQDAVLTSPATARNAKARAMSALHVEAHIIAEDFAVARLLHNNVKEASRESLGTNSIVGPYSWITQQSGGASHQNRGAEKIVQQFIWHIHSFTGIVQLPPPCTPVHTNTNMSDKQTMAAFTHADPTPFP